MSKENNTNTLLVAGSIALAFVHIALTPTAEAGTQAPCFGEISIQSDCAANPQKHMDRGLSPIH